MSIKEEFEKILLSKLEESQIIKGDSSDAYDFLQEKRGNFISECSYILLPKSAEEVSFIVKLCNKFNIKIVPQSGNTGLSGGSVSTSEYVIINSKNLNKIISIDAENFSITLESGVILADIHASVLVHNLMYPLSLASEKTCTIGGNIASNAGGINVIRYGNTRDLVLGLEVILPNGEIYSDLNILRKRNIGSDFKHLFIGSEGTLGFVTKVSLKLLPAIDYKTSALMSFSNLSDAIAVFQKIYESSSQYISAFEVMHSNAVNLVLENSIDILWPLKKQSTWYALLSIDIPKNISKDFTNILESNLNSVLKSSKQIKEYFITADKKIWNVRYDVAKSETSLNYSIKNDIGVPISSIATFVETMLETIKQKYSDLYPIVFGHLGDGNLHFNFTNKKGSSFDVKSVASEVKDLISSEVIKHNGTFSAEHGVGLIHKDELRTYYKYQHNMLKTIKNALDLNNIFNPNKII